MQLPTLLDLCALELKQSTNVKLNISEHV
jgi:hypothetical protein